MPDPVLIDEFFLFLQATCRSIGCQNEFDPSEPLGAVEDIELWSCRSAEEAEAQGWVASNAGEIFCPVHAPNPALKPTRLRRSA